VRRVAAADRDCVLAERELAQTTWRPWMEREMRKVAEPGAALVERDDPRGAGPGPRRYGHHARPLLPRQPNHVAHQRPRLRRGIAVSAEPDDLLIDSGHGALKSDRRRALVRDLPHRRPRQRRTPALHAADPARERRAQRERGGRT